MTPPMPTAPRPAHSLVQRLREAQAAQGWLPRETFDRVVRFVATGGYALATYERFAKIREGKDGLWRVANPRIAQQYRMNVGTIIDTPTVKIRLVGKRRGRRGGRGCRGRRPPSRRGRCAARTTAAWWARWR